MEIPKNWKDLIGQTKRLKGHVLSWSKEVDDEFLIHDVRFGTGTIMNCDTLESIHPTIQLLVSNKSLKRKVWTKSFACREIDLRSVS